jgi:hypothetical protein
MPIIFGTMIALMAQALLSDQRYQAVLIHIWWPLSKRWKDLGKTSQFYQFLLCCKMLHMDNNVAPK